MATPLTTLRQKVRERLMETLALTTPGSPLVSVQGTPGTATIAYKITATNSEGESDASQTKTVLFAAAVLNGTNFNRLTWQAVPGATGYNIYRISTTGASPITLGYIGSPNVVPGSNPPTTYDDTGSAGDGSTAPTVNTSGIDAPFWTEQELLDILILGCKDLWKAIVDLHQGHFTSINEDDVTLDAGDTELTGVPDDCFRVLMIEARDLTDSSAYRYIYFKPLQYHNLKFQAARSYGTSAGFPSDWAQTVYYDILNAGSPVDAPAIIVAPPLSSSLNLRLVYVRVLPTLVETDDNPIPGESDNALINWACAWARAKERPDRMPDPAYLSVYNTEKQGLLTALTPRQEQEEEIVEGLFDGFQ